MLRRQRMLSSGPSEAVAFEGSFLLPAPLSPFRALPNASPPVMAATFFSSAAVSTCHSSSALWSCTPTDFDCSWLYQKVVCSPAAGTQASAGFSPMTREGVAQACRPEAQQHAHISSAMSGLPGCNEQYRVLQAADERCPPAPLSCWTP